MLGAFVLALNNDSGWQVSDSDRRISAVNMLTTLARGPVGVYLQVVRVDFNFDVFIYFRIDKNRGKGSVTALVGVEGRDSYQPVYSRFLAEQPEAVITLDPDGGALQTGFFSRLEIDDFGLEAFSFGKSKVHAKEHLGPVLGFCAAGSGMDGQDGVAGVILVEEKCPEFSFLKFNLEGLYGPVEIVHNLFAFLGQFQQDFYFFPVGLQFFIELQVLFQLFFSDLKGLEFFLVIPGSGAGQLTVDIL